MEKATVNYNLISDKFESILMELPCTFNKIDFLDDNDMNYVVLLNTSGKLSKLEQIPSIIYININNFSVHIIVPNIYKFSENESINPFYKKINIVNRSIDGGTFSIYEDAKQITYSGSIYCGKDFAELSYNKIKLLIDMTLVNLKLLLDIISQK